MARENFDLIPFPAEFSGDGNLDDNLKVHCTKGDDGAPRRLAARELIAVVTGKNVNDAGKVWRTLDPEVMAGLEQHVSLFRFDVGRGSRMQPVLTLQGAFKLFMALPGKRAKLFRAGVARVLLGYFAGDEALVAEVRNNKENTDLINELAREELREVQAAEGGAVPPAPAAEEEGAAEVPAGPAAGGVVDELKQRELAVALGKQELALQRAQLRARLEEQKKLAEAEVARKAMIADAERANKEKDTAAEVAAMKKLAITQRDNDDLASTHKRRRLDEEALTGRRNMDAEIALVRTKGEAEAAALRTKGEAEAAALRTKADAEAAALRIKAAAEFDAQRANMAVAVLDLTTALRGAGQPPETITAAVAALIVRLGMGQQQQAAPQPAPQAPQPVPPPAAAPAAPQRPSARYFTVFEFMQRPTMVGVLSKIRGRAARDVFYQKMGRRLTAECAKKFFAVVKEVYVPSEGRNVNVYDPVAEDLAREVAVALLREIYGGEQQRNIVQMFASQPAP